MLVAITSLQKEGQLDTRMYAKQALGRLKELMAAGGQSLNSHNAKQGPEIEKVIFCLVPSAFSCMIGHTN